MINSQILTNLSIITSFHDKKKSILDAFLPLVEYGISQLNFETETYNYNTDDLKTRIYDVTGININKLSLISLLKKMKKEGIIELMDNGSYFSVKDRSKANQNEYLMAVKRFNRESHRLIKNFKEEMCDDRSEDEIIQWIYDFIDRYRSFIEIKDSEINIDVDANEYASLIKYLQIIDKSEDDFQNTFINIYLGYNICNILNSGKNAVKAELNKIIVYLDSNFILRLMDLQEENFTRETLELFEIIKNSNVKIRIFEETVIEIKSVIEFYRNKYINDKEFYESIMDKPEYIDGVLGAFFRRKLSNTQIDDIVSNIYNKLAEWKIDIDNIEKYKFVIEENEIKKLYDNKYMDAFNANEKQIQYRIKKCENYLKITKIIHYLRNDVDRNASSLGNCRYIFLTCDWKLYKYNKLDDTKLLKYPATITQEILANDLLLLNPQELGKLSYNLLISLYNNSKYLNVRILSDLGKMIIEISKLNPDIAEYIGKATRNCEYYPIFNEIYDDDNPDNKSQILEFVKKLQENDLKKKQAQNTIMMLKEETLAAKDIEITDASQKIISYEEKLDKLQKELFEMEQKQFKLQENHRDKIKKICDQEVKKYGKKLRYWCVAISIVGALAGICFSILTSISSLINSTKIVAIVILVILFLASIYTIIINSKDNKWVNEKMEKMRKKLYKENEID